MLSLWDRRNKNYLPTICYALRNADKSQAARKSCLLLGLWIRQSGDEQMRMTECSESHFINIIIFLFLRIIGAHFKCYYELSWVQFLRQTCISCCLRNTVRVAVKTAYWDRLSLNTLSYVTLYQKYVGRLLENSDVWFEGFKVKGWGEKSSHSEPLVSLWRYQTIPWETEAEQLATEFGVASCSRWKTLLRAYNGSSGLCLSPNFLAWKD